MSRFTIFGTFSNRMSVITTSHRSLLSHRGFCLESVGFLPRAFESDLFLDWPPTSQLVFCVWSPRLKQRIPEQSLCLAQWSLARCSFSKLAGSLWWRMPLSKLSVWWTRDWLEHEDSKQCSRGLSCDSENKTFHPISSYKQLTTIQPSVWLRETVKSSNSRMHDIIKICRDANLLVYNGSPDYSTGWTEIGKLTRKWIKAVSSGNWLEFLNFCSTRPYMCTVLYCIV